MKILVIGPSWVGDMMMSQSLYRTLKAEHPDAVIDVMAPAWCRPLLSRMPEVNQALAMPLGHGALEIGERRRLGKSLRGSHYDRAYVLPNSFKSALVPFFAGIKRRVGWRGEMRYGLLNDLRKLDKAAFPLMVERYVALGYDTPVSSAKQLPQPLLWPQLQVEDQEKLKRQRSFSFLPIVLLWASALALSLVQLNVGRTTIMPRWRSNSSLKAIKWCCSARQKIVLPVKRSLRHYLTKLVPIAVICPAIRRWNKQ